MLLLIWACGSGMPDSTIVILYDNDVHCAVEGYAKFSAVASEARRATPYVTKVSCGDFIQGDVIGSATRGSAIIDIMNKVGYDVVTLGNHEFDFGVERMAELMDSLNATVVCANFKYLPTNTLCFKPYTIVEYGDIEIAYVGVTTTTTPINTIPQTFRDDKGELLYDFNISNFHKTIQSYIDSARSDGADYVVLLSHLGDARYGDHPTSIDLIRNTRGVDVVLDGHAHGVIRGAKIPNAVGDSVLLTSTGNGFKYIGKLTLSQNGKFVSELIATLSPETPIDTIIQEYVNQEVDYAIGQGERIVGKSLVTLPFEDGDDNRISYACETAIGDFCADAYRTVLGADIAVVNGGGIRASIEKGNLTFNDLYAVFPFNNIACLSKISGHELLRAMEVAVSWLPEGDGSFLQVSGMRFDVNLSIPSPVMFGLDGLFVALGEGPRRVANLQIFDFQSATYKDVEPDKTYLVASYNYLLKDLGAAGMFRYTELLNDNLGQDVEILVSYIENFLDGVIPQSYSAPSNRINIKH